MRELISYLRDSTKEVVGFCYCCLLLFASFDIIFRIILSELFH